MHVAGLTLPCALGPAGVRHGKREGDGATPAGRYRLLFGYFRADRTQRPNAALPLVAVRARDGWCDDPAHRLYNRPARLPLSASAETMRREDRLYDVVIVTDHNQRPRVRGRGSAIFFHIAREGFTPTQGCVAISPDAMRRLLPRLARSAEIVIE
ncbi:MAG: L,D-transpeptidase family protein [Rhizobiales bacterium]|nr:L,D-transpeptidase family protein [Hyphomicrobiales bacterium]